MSLYAPFPVTRQNSAGGGFFCICLLYTSHFSLASAAVAADPATRFIHMDLLLFCVGSRIVSQSPPQLLLQNFEEFRPRPALQPGTVAAAFKDVNPVLLPGACKRPANAAHGVRVLLSLDQCDLAVQGLSLIHILKEIMLAVSRTVSP